MKKTKDLYFAAALLAVGATYDGVNREDPKHMEFQFSVPRKFDNPVLNDAAKNVEVGLDLDRIEVLWVNDTLMVNAKAYKDAIQRMKTIIHSK